MSLPRPCLTCGTLAKDARCPEHRPRDADRQIKRPSKDRRAAGYDAAWDRLSARARALQPFCETCGTREDLTTDHLPRAWARKALGLPVRLQDVQVLCRSHNSALGEAKPGSKRYRAWLESVAQPAPRGASQAAEGSCAPWVAPERVTVSRAAQT